MSALVISAFPATGKSWLASSFAPRSAIVDSDSSLFSWRLLPRDRRERHPEWPGNYMAHIRRMLAAGDALILVSTHAEVRAALADSGIPFVLVYPTPDQREEYRERMKRRGSPPALISKVCDELWDDALAECAAQTGCGHVVLGSGQYLMDALPRAMALHGKER